MHKILLVDDEIEFIETLAERLSFREIFVDLAINGKEAIQKSCEKQYDLVILDLKMPQMNGFLVKKEISKISPKTKFILLTGNISDSAFKEFQEEANIMHHLTKPVTIDNLIKTIKEALS